MKKLSIGQMAKMSGVSVQTLRLYDETGILKPIETNEESGYRYYDVKQNAALDMIRYLKQAGIPLKTIKDIFDHHDIVRLNEALHKREEDLLKEMEEIHLQKKALERLIDANDRYLKAPDDGTITLEHMEEREIYGYHTGINFYDYDLDTYENLLQKLRNDMMQDGFPALYYHNVGTTIKKEDFERGKNISDQIFVFVDTKKKGKNTLTAGLYACIYCDDFEKEKKAIDQLREYIKKEGYEIVGDYICEVLTELPFFSSWHREMFLRLQIPVSLKK